MHLKKIRHISKLVVGWILLIQLINISVDPPDLVVYKNHTVTAEDLTINEAESIYELIAEGIFDLDVPEAEDNDQDEQLKTFNLYFLASPDTGISLPSFPEPHDSGYNASLLTSYPEPNAPPPKFPLI